MKRRMKTRKFKMYSFAVMLSVVSVSLISSVAHAEGEMIENRMVLSSNDQIQILDANQAPYRSVCFLYINNSVRGSGVVIGKNAILTTREVASAAENGESINIKVNEGRTSKNDYNGTFYGKEIKYSPDNQDIAIVYLNPNDKGKNIGDEDSIVNYISSSGIQEDALVKIIGYPVNKPFATMWETTGTVIGEKNEMIYYSGSAGNENLGSPVFNEKNELIGIYSSKTSKGEGLFVPLKPRLYEFIKKNVDAPLIEGDTQTIEGKEGQPLAEVDARGNLGEVDATNPNLPLPEGDDRWLKITLPTAVVFESDESKSKITSPKNYKIENKSGRPVKVDVASYEVTDGDGIPALTTLNIQRTAGYGGNQAVSLITNGAKKAKYDINTEFVRLANNQGDYGDINGTGEKATNFEFSGTMDQAKLTKSQNLIESKLTLKFVPLRMDGKTTVEAKE